MEKHIVPLQIRWADIDLNNHLRHSVYYDFGAFSRMKLFTDLGITIAKLNVYGIGPVILREEAVFRREIKFEDQISIGTELTKATADFSRWSYRHSIVKSDGTLATTMNIDGAWIDVTKRKIAVPPEEVRILCDQIPKAADFEVIIPVSRQA